ncbi:MAG: hypothetical protein ACRCZ2_14125, partial [Fusobacteriaceae bacterium]
LDQEYHFAPFTYRWDGEKWKTLGRGSTPVTDAINEHKADPKAHSPFVIGAFPMKGTSLDITDLNSLTASLTDEGFYYQDQSAKALVDAYHYPVQEAGALVVSRSAWGVQQEYTSYNTGRKFSRGKINHTDWHPWKEYFINDGGAALLINKPHGAIYLKAPTDADPCYMICTTAGVNNWYVGKGGAGNDVVLSSYKNNNFIAIKSDRVEAAKPLFVGADRVVTEKGRHYYYGEEFQAGTCPAAGTFNLTPQTDSTRNGITRTANEFTVSKTGLYKISYGFQLEPATVDQQVTSEVLVNSTTVVGPYAYLPKTSSPTIAPTMSTTSHVVVRKVDAGGKIYIRIKSANNLTGRLWPRGYINIEEIGYV